MRGGTGQIDGVAMAPLRTHRTGGHCGSCALRDLLEHHALDFGAGPLTEGEVFVLAGGLSALFSDAPPEATPGMIGTYLFGRSQTLEEDLCENLGVECEPASTTDPELAWRWVRSEIDAGEPVMVWADIGHLDYLDVRMHNSNHDVIVVGYDEAAGEVLLADHELPEIQRCGLASFAAARASRDFPGPHGHRTWFLRWPDALPPATAAVARGMHAVADRILEGERGVPYPTGLNAIVDLRGAIGRWQGLDDRSLRDRFRRLWFCIDKAGTGGGFFRALWADGLGRFGQLLADPELFTLAGLYASLAGEWSALAADGLGLERDSAVAAMALRAERIAALEEEAACRLRAWAREQLTPASTNREEP